eukprot:scaffold2263_cov272-Pinguiococcus_pyrenoidosus.AAC.6
MCPETAPVTRAAPQRHTEVSTCLVAFVPNKPVRHEKDLLPLDRSQKKMWSSPQVPISSSDRKPRERTGALEVLLVKTNSLALQLYTASAWSGSMPRDANSSMLGENAR